MKQSLASLTLETKDSAPDGTFEGYGAVFGNTDRDGDIVAPGAFAESLKERLPALLWQHNVKEPIGRFDVVREDKKGLYVKGRLSAHGRGREAYDLLKMGALDGLSIGFVTKEAQRSRASGTRTITKADLMEVSLVTFPANELARISTVKQRTDLMTHDDTIDDPRSFERFLRENGFSRSRAKAITAKGFRRENESVVAHEISHMISDLKQKQLNLQHHNHPVWEEKKGEDNALYRVMLEGISNIVSAFGIDLLRGSREEELLREIDQTIFDYAARAKSNPMRQNVSLRPGQSARLKFNANHNRDTRTLTIVSDKPSETEFSGKLHYVRATKNGFFTDFKRVHFGADGNYFQADINRIGVSDDINDWRRSIALGGQANTALTNLKRIARHNPPFPYLELKYTRSKNGDRSDPATFVASLT